MEWLLVAAEGIVAESALIVAEARFLFLIVVSAEQIVHFEMAIVTRTSPAERSGA
jgi:hypothetical protein